ncbi:MAG: glycosyl hydrolase family 28 protein [bacterium]|nr:glycosyl hydrolase family 28 protein [bacterium]
MKKIIILLFISFAFSTNAQTFDITKYGAIGDAKTINTKAIQNTIDTCFKNGGGTVYVPAGIFMMGTVNLKSNVNLHLESGAILRGSADINDYLPVNGVHYGMFFTENSENITISGSGNIDANGGVFFDATKAKKIEWGGVTGTRQKENFRKVVDGSIGDGPIVPKERPYQTIIFSNCKRVTIKDVFITQSTFWTILIADCDSVLIDGIRLWTNMLAPNADGIDITSGKNITISNCDVRTGDDAIIVVGYASHFEVPGFKDLRHSSENINIINCNLQSSSSAIRIGYFDHNSVRNINISNCNITNSTRGIGIFLRDQGSLENINVSNVNIETKLRTGDWWGNGEPIHISAVRGKVKVAGTETEKLGVIKNVTFNNVNCKAENGILVYGSEESRLQNINFKNVTFDFIDSKLNDVAGGNIDLRGCLDEKQQLFQRDIPGIYGQYVDNLTIEDFKLTWTGTRMPYFTNGIEINNFNDVRIANFKGSGSPINKMAVPVLLENGTNTDLVLNKKIIAKKINVKN